MKHRYNIIIADIPSSQFTSCSYSLLYKNSHDKHLFRRRMQYFVQSFVQHWTWVTVLLHQTKTIICNECSSKLTEKRSSRGPPVVVNWLYLSVDDFAIVSFSALRAFRWSQYCVFCRNAAHPSTCNDRAWSFRQSSFMVLHFSIIAKALRRNGIRGRQNLIESIISSIAIDWGSVMSACASVTPSCVLIHSTAYAADAFCRLIHRMPSSVGRGWHYFVSR